MTNNTCCLGICPQLTELVPEGWKAEKYGAELSSLPATGTSTPLLLSSSWHSPAWICWPLPQLGGIGSLSQDGSDGTVSTLSTQPSTSSPSLPTARPGRRPNTPSGRTEPQDGRNLGLWVLGRGRASPATPELHMSEK